MSTSSLGTLDRLLPVFIDQIWASLDPKDQVALLCCKKAQELWNAFQTLQKEQCGEALHQAWGSHSKRDVQAFRNRFYNLSIEHPQLVPLYREDCIADYCPESHTTSMRILIRQIVHILTYKPLFAFYVDLQRAKSAAEKKRLLQQQAHCQAAEECYKKTLNEMRVQRGMDPLFLGVLDVLRRTQQLRAETSSKLSKLESRSPEVRLEAQIKHNILPCLDKLAKQKEGSAKRFLAEHMGGCADREGIQIDKASPKLFKHLAHPHYRVVGSYAFLISALTAYEQANIRS